MFHFKGNLCDDAAVQAAAELVRRGGRHRGRGLLPGRGVATERRRLRNILEARQETFETTILPPRDDEQVSADGRTSGLKLTRETIIF